jgi:RNA polymerase sigma-70 factor (ECF subfamily)
MDFEREMLALLPTLRGFARGLTRNRSDADDLVQDAVLRMWHARDRFEPGTNLRAWAFTIVRNRFYNAFVPRRRLEALDDLSAERLSQPAMQERQAEGRDIRQAIYRLDPRLREVLALTVGAELGYEEAASIMGCPVGTVKSRVFRARRELRRLLHLQGLPREDPDRHQRPTPLPRPRVVIVEDEYILAMEMKALMTQSEVRADISTCATLRAGIDLCRRLPAVDLAILDILLPDGEVFPLVEPLLSKGARIVFASSYQRERIPERYQHFRHVPKPFSLEAMDGVWA